MTNNKIIVDGHPFGIVSLPAASAPDGYELKDGKLYINEEEAEAIRIIFDRYVNTENRS